MKLNNAIHIAIKTTETRQTTMQAMDIYLSAAHRPEALRVTKSGKVEIVGHFTALFGRLARAINLKKISTKRLPTGHRRHARQFPRK